MYLFLLEQLQYVAHLTMLPSKMSDATTYTDTEELPANSKFYPAMQLNRVVESRFNMDKINYKLFHLVLESTWPTDKLSPVYKSHFRF